MEMNRDRTIILAIGLVFLVCVCLALGGAFLVANQFTTALNATATTSALRAQTTATAGSLSAAGTATTASLKAAGTATSVALPTMQAQATQIVAHATLDRADSLPLIGSDDFKSNLNIYNWPAGVYNDSYWAGKAGIVDGAYTYEVTTKKPLSWIAIPGMRRVSDFVASVDVQHLQDSTDTTYGLIFRVVDRANYYRLVLREDQFFHFSKLENGRWTTLIGSSEAPMLQPRQVNHLVVVGQGTHFTFFINNQYVAGIDDDTFSSGWTGVGFDILNVGTAATLKFSNFSVRGLVATPVPTATSTPLSSSAVQSTPIASSTP